MKKLVVMLIMLTMSLGVCSVGYASDTNTVVYNDDISAELYNVKTGEIETITLEDCETRVITYGEEQAKEGVIISEGTFYLPGDGENDNRPSTRAHIGGDDSDKSGGIDISMRIDYRTIYDDSLTEEEQKRIKITNVEGYWTVNDSSISLSDREVGVFCSSILPYVHQERKYTEDDSEIDGNTFEIDPKFDEYAYASGYNATIGAIATVTLTRGTSSEWEFRYDTLSDIAGSDMIEWD